jgi:hypothetical protein
MRIPEPQYVVIDEFMTDWVHENWLPRLGRLSPDRARVPQRVVVDALRAMYQRDNELHETREEIRELQDNRVRWVPSRLRRSSAVLVAYLSIALLSIVRPLANRCRFGERIRDRLQDTRQLIDSSRDGSARRSAWFAKRASEMRAERRQHFIQKAFSSAGFLFTGVTAVFMSLMLVVGLVTLWNAVCEGLGLPGLVPAVLMIDHHQDDMATAPHVEPLARAHHASVAEMTGPDPHAAMLTSLAALEIILVAPLPYLLVLGLMRYIKALAYQEQADEFRKELLEFKAFEVALFIAIIAAAVVGRVLQQQLDLEFAISVSLIIGAFALYYFLIERSGDAVARSGVASQGAAEDTSSAPPSKDIHDRT